MTAVSKQPDYFSNHRLKLRFPWSLYHRPIIHALSRALTVSPGPEVLNVGSGPFFELAELPRTDHRLTVCDTDARAIELAQQVNAGRLERADVIVPDRPLPYEANTFDLVVSMDVVEHVPDPPEWLRELFRVLKPGGVLFLTTPNYASLSLRAIENTALELIAQLQGFSRKHIHPSKMTPTLLESALQNAGASTLHIDIISNGWVLSSLARKA